MTLAPELKDTSPEKLLAPVLSAFWDEDKSWTLDVYRRHDGYEGLRKALTRSRPDWGVDLLSKDWNMKAFREE